MARPRQATHMGPLSPNSADAKHYLPKRIVFSVPERISNASMRGTYSQADAHKASALRPGCQDFLRLKSLG